MTRKIFVKCLAPGFGPNETVTEYVDTLLDFAQFYDFPDFQILAQTLDVLEKELGSILCKELPEEPSEFLLDLQSDVIVHACKSINEELFLKRASALAKKIRDNPGQTMHYDRAVAGKTVYETFEGMFREEVEGYSRYQRIVARFIWRFDNWFGDKIAVAYSSCMTDMVAEVNYWKMARQVSVMRALG